MGTSSYWLDRSTFRLDRHNPYLHLHFIMVFVRDQERSLAFYRDQLGFTVVVDFIFPTGGRWLEVSPPDGTAKIALVPAKPGSEEYQLIGRVTHAYFLTEDVDGTYDKWNARGVRFHFAPKNPTWGGRFTSFEDIDGNSFGLAGFDEATREAEERRRAVAERAEAERRAAQELEIAKQVQARLFPQTVPAFRTLQYAGRCIQARQVGGDYYDFLDLGEGRVGLIIGDISGKGIAAALLMANLQANIRSQSAFALDEPQRLLRSVNRLFYDNTADSSYATLFFAIYDDTSQVLHYANCGHLPALLLRDGGHVERLEATSTVLGLFREWECSMQSCHLAQGDALAIYTDGVTEACDERGEEFGEERLIAALRRGRELTSDALLASVVADVCGFNAKEQYDDITLIVAKCGAEPLA